MRNYLFWFVCGSLIIFVVPGAQLRAEVPGSGSYGLRAWGWNQAGCSDAGARSSSSFSLLDSLGPPMISMGSDGLPYFASASTRCYMDVLFCTLVAGGGGVAQNYLELMVRPNGSGGYDFNPGDTLVLEWTVYPDQYGFANMPCSMYIGAAKNPPGEGTVVTIPQILGSRALYLFDFKKKAHKYNPGHIMRMYGGVRFPVPGIGTGGTMSFRLPGGAAGRWAFVGVFIKAGGRYPADPPVEVSDGFTLH